MAAGIGRPDSTYDALPEEPQVGISLRQRSRRLLHAASRALTGGAAVLPLPVGARGDAIAPPRQPGTRRDQRQSRVAHRVVELLLNRFRVWIVLFSIVVIILALTMVCLFGWVVYAEITCRKLPCDQPLEYFVIVSLVVGEVKQLVLMKCLPQRLTHHPCWAFVIGIFAAIPGWIIIGWGIYMINACKTCQETNPGLYYPTKYFIYAQIPLGILITLFFSIGFTLVLVLLMRISDRQTIGCEEAVHQLPKVPSDSPELIDGEDGKVMECPICLRTLGSDVVRTECVHYFHESCLATWCQNHVDCPLCRAQVGPIDGSGMSTPA